jgi:glycine/D-amino acid oxidase-like deaminating enzyme
MMNCRRSGGQHLLLFVVLLVALLTVAVKPTYSFHLGTETVGQRGRSRKPIFASLATSSSEMMAGDDDNKKMHVVIAGAGIIGTCTAYYLVHNHDDIVDCVTLIDPSGRIAPAASGKAGGFLAQNWNDGSPTQELTRRSFVLHQELANVLSPESIQYRRLTCLSVAVESSNMNRRPSGKKLEGIEWAQPTDDSSSVILGVSPIGDEKTIAQVHPRMLCERLWQETCKKSPKSKLVKGRVTGAVHDASDTMKLIGAKLHGDDDHDHDNIVKGDALLFSCGPWTANIMQ